MWDLLVAKLGAERLAGLRLWEDPTLYVSTTGARPGGSAVATMELDQDPPFFRGPPPDERGAPAGGERSALWSRARDHGHNYALEATVRGVVDADGMVIDLTALEGAMRTVVDRDHRSHATSPRSPA
jgi:hypothetical protein